MTVIKKSTMTIGVGNKARISIENEQIIRIAPTSLPSASPFMLALSFFEVVLYPAININHLPRRSCMPQTVNIKINGVMNTMIDQSIKKPPPSNIVYLNRCQ